MLRAIDKIIYNSDEIYLEQKFKFVISIPVEKSTCSIVESNDKLESLKTSELFLTELTLMSCNLDRTEPM